MHGVKRYLFVRSLGLDRQIGILYFKTCRLGVIYSSNSSRQFGMILKIYNILVLAVYFSSSKTVVKVPMCG
jgi:hypothetical protein